MRNHVYHLCALQFPLFSARLQCVQIFDRVGIQSKFAHDFLLQSGARSRFPPHLPINFCHSNIYQRQNNRISAITHRNDLRSTFICLDHARIVSQDAPGADII